MAYRKITVRGIECKYVVGRTHVKIQVPGQGSKAFPKDKIGTFVEHVDFNEMTEEVEVCGRSDTSVTPANIARAIRSHFSLTNR